MKNEIGSKPLVFLLYSHVVVFVLINIYIFFLAFYVFGLCISESALHVTVILM